MQLTDANSTSMNNPIPLEARRLRAQRELRELKAEINKTKAEALTWRRRYEAGGGEKALRAEQKAQGHLMAVLEEMDQFIAVNRELLETPTTEETSDDGKTNS